MKLALALALIFILSPQAFCERSVAIVNLSVGSRLVDGDQVDDFEDGVQPNKWGGTFTTFTSGAGGSINMVYGDPVLLPNTDAGARSLKVDYVLTDPGFFAGVVTPLGTGPKNIAGYLYLQFYVRGNQTGQALRIELQNASSDAARRSSAVYLSDYTDGPLTTAWTWVRIPLNAFSNLDSLENATNIVFVLERDHAAANGAPASGTIWLDNISFGNSGSVGTP
jgi:hypothetical protein